MTHKSQKFSFKSLNLRKIIYLFDLKKILLKSVSPKTLKPLWNKGKTWGITSFLVIP